MADLSLEGVPQQSLNKCVKKLDELTKWAVEEQVDRWAFRASLIKALYEDADRYFASGEGTFREIAAFDNGVAAVVRRQEQQKKSSGEPRK